MMIRWKTALVAAALLSASPALGQSLLKVGETSARLPHGRYHCWVLETTPGSHWEISMESQAADPILSIGRGSDCETAQWDLTNDDSGGLFGTRNSRLRFTAGGGVYLVKARYYFAAEAPYLLRVQEGGRGGRTLPSAGSLEEVAPAIAWSRIPIPEGAASQGEGPLSGAASAPGQAFRDCEGCPEMVVLPAGSYLRGSSPEEAGRDPIEGPLHQVDLSRPFAISSREVTFDEYDACVADRGCPAVSQDNGWGRGRRPVVNVPHASALRYVAWLSTKTGQQYFLPTEAEWEYAARAGSTTPWNTGEAIITDDANFMKLFGKTVTVGSYPPNAFGLYDMHGNVAEWTQDCLDTGYLGVPRDGSAAIAGDCAQKRIVRGGSYDSVHAGVRSAARLGVPSDKPLSDVGFRITRRL